MASSVSLMSQPGGASAARYGITAPTSFRLRILNGRRSSRERYVAGWMISSLGMRHDARDRPERTTSSRVISSFTGMPPALGIRDDVGGMEGMKPILTSKASPLIACREQCEYSAHSHDTGARLVLFSSPLAGGGAKRSAPTGRWHPSAQGGPVRCASACDGSFTPPP